MHTVDSICILRILVLDCTVDIPYAYYMHTVDSRMLRNCTCHSSNLHPQDITILSLTCARASVKCRPMCDLNVTDVLTI